MVDLTRREAVRISAITAMAGAGASAGPVSAAEAVHAEANGAADNGIGRFELTPSIAGIPRISYASTHGNIAYLAGVTADPRDLGDVKDQTRKILARIDSLLAAVGTNKSKVLTAQVWLTDMELFAAHNDAWNEWVDAKNPPVRACLLSPRLWRPGMLVEIMVTAAL
jgi:enamine deaminase RidA (YjgF/YER057c/UK114 family)